MTFFRRKTCAHFISWFVSSLTLGSTVFVHPVLGEDKPYIAVGTARTKKIVLAFPEVLADEKLREPSRVIQNTFTHDLLFMDQFRFMDKAAFLEREGAGVTLDGFKLSDWSSIGVEILAKAALTREGKSLHLEAHLYDVKGSREVLVKRYVGSEQEAKVIAHTFANDAVKALTGLPGIFLTKIAMSCERNRKKELYIMNFDGSEARQLTRHNTIAFSPAWSPDGSRIAYSVYARRRDNTYNIDLYELDFRSNTLRLLSNRKGINSGAVYSPDGKRIALTMSFAGNPEIFSLERETGTVTRLTRSFGFDVDPDFSPDGKKLAFVSSRTGMPMIFNMGIDGNSVQRLTFAGRYNATPSWSQQNTKIAFAGWVDGHFDIFIMNPDGTHLERLTKNEGNNEDPAFSPDGNFIVFRSNRAGGENVYVMNVDGTYVKRLSYGLGNCFAPKWSR